MTAPIYIALGGNIPSDFGSPLETLQEVVRALPRFGCDVIRLSSWYQTPAMTPDEQPDFINAVAEIEADLDPEALLDCLHAIEAQFGRERRVRWGERVVDLDLIDFRQQVLIPERVPDTQPGEVWTSRPLALPHPELEKRAFVLLPLAEIAPNWVHPRLSTAVSTLVAGLSEEDRAGLVRVG